MPVGGDAYILSRIIHDWDDEAALKILGNCRRAIRSDGRLLVVEGVSKPPNEPDPNKFLDVWFIGGGGCERTETEYRALLRRGGFTLERVVPTGEFSGSRVVPIDNRGESERARGKIPRHDSAAGTHGRPWAVENKESR